MKKIKICPKEKTYTLKDKCPKCGATTLITAPPKFSVDDKYANYRRQAKEKGRTEAGLL